MGVADVLPVSQSPPPVQLVNEPEFIAPAECERLISLANREAERDGGRTYTRNGGKRTEIPYPALMRAFAEDAPFLLSLRSKVVERCEALWSVCNPDESPPLKVNFSLFSASRPGDMHSRHADNARRDPVTLQWGPNHTPFRVLTALTYLNTCDHDFDGGEIYFSRLNMAVKPQAGLLIASPCDKRWEHQVLPVIRGTRCVLAIWFTTDPARVERVP